MNVQDTFPYKETCLPLILQLCTRKLLSDLCQTELQIEAIFCQLDHAGTRVSFHFSNCARTIFVAVSCKGYLSGTVKWTIAHRFSVCLVFCIRCN